MSIRGSIVLDERLRALQDAVYSLSKINMCRDAQVLINKEIDNTKEKIKHAELEDADDALANGKPSWLKKTVWMKSGGKCWYCGKQTHPFGSDRDAFCIDHFIAKGVGGKDAVDNLVPCCSHCNTVKGTKGIEEFRKRIVGDKAFYFEEAEQ